MAYRNEREQLSMVELHELCGVKCYIYGGGRLKYNYQQTLN